MKALTLPEYGWKNHPAVKQWKNYEYCLYVYHVAIVEEWVARGFKDTTFGSMNDMVCPMIQDGTIIKHLDRPAFLGLECFHASHRSNLLRKDPDWYSQFGWKEDDSLAYYWPSHHEELV